MGADGVRLAGRQHGSVRQQRGQVAALRSRRPHAVAVHRPAASRHYRPQGSQLDLGRGLSEHFVRPEHDALDAVHVGITGKKVNYVPD